MKLKHIFCLILTCAFLNSMGQQLSKAEIKAWKKIAKQYQKNPSELKDITESKSEAVQKAQELEATNSSMLSDLNNLKSQVSSLENDASKVTAKLDSVQAAFDSYRSLKEAEVVTEQSKSTDYSVGLVFKVQIGAFKKKNLAKYFDNNPNLGGEEGKDPDDPQRITIGIFRDYWEANTFKKYMREMGVTDAWIVPYQDGVRVPLSSVLSDVPEQN